MMGNCKIIKHVFAIFLLLALHTVSNAQQLQNNGPTKITLVGVVTGKKFRRAIIEDQTGQQHYYKIGTSIERVGRIIRIKREGITILDGNSEKFLSLGWSSTSQPKLPPSKSGKPTAIPMQVAASGASESDSPYFPAGSSSEQTTPSNINSADPNLHANDKPNDHSSNNQSPSSGPIPPVGGQSTPTPGPKSSQTRNTFGTTQPPISKTPKIASISQKQGPLSGDHLLKLRISDIHGEQKVEFFLEAKSCLNLQRIAIDEFNCLTPPSALPQKVDVILKIDGQPTDIYVNGYEYFNDENIKILSRDDSVPDRLFGASAIQGDKLYFWGGNDRAGKLITEGIEYDSFSDQWSKLNSQGQPQPTSGAAAISTAKEFIVWGGQHTSYTNMGGRYDFNNKTWRPINVLGAPTPRSYASAVWTGEKMIIWGGEVVTGGIQYRLNTGGIYDPEKDSWTTMAAPPTGIVGRSHHFAFWDGQEMKIWAGYGAGLSTTQGYFAAFNPTTNQWRKIIAAHDYTGLFSKDLGWAYFSGTKWISKALLSSDVSDHSELRFFDSANGSWFVHEKTKIPNIEFKKLERTEALWSGRYLYIITNGARGFQYGFK